MYSKFSFHLYEYLKYPLGILKVNDLYKNADQFIFFCPQINRASQCQRVDVQAWGDVSRRDRVTECMSSVLVRRVRGRKKCVRFKLEKILLLKRDSLL